ncbi:transporter substrate-binding domain-containing protein [Pseudomonas fluorescens]|uniref:transporter substrate-binding domain-containing protein n=1 Tax=Pseudomonas fluorescens TaxID=294 RepID=UPI003975C6BC
MFQEFDGIIPSLKVRKIDAVLSSMSITEDRLKSVDFTARYYHTPAVSPPSSRKSPVSKWCAMPRRTKLSSTGPTGAWTPPSPTSSTPK